MTRFNDPGVMSEIQAAIALEGARFVDVLCTSVTRGCVRLYNGWDGTTSDEVAVILAVHGLGTAGVTRVAVEEDLPEAAAVEIEVTADLELRVEAYDDNAESYRCNVTELVHINATFDRQARRFGELECDLIEIDFAKVRQASHPRQPS